MKKATMTVSGEGPFMTLRIQWEGKREEDFEIPVHKDRLKAFLEELVRDLESIKSELAAGRSVQA